MLDIITYDNELVVDSRLVADELGIEHASFFKTIKKYYTEICELGGLDLKSEPCQTSGGTQFVSFCYLNEDQATYVMTLSRNTDKVRQCKRNLVKAFSAAKQVIKQVIPQQSDRIKELEMQLAIATQNNQANQAALASKQMDNTMLTLHGKEVVLALRGLSDQIVRVEEVVTEVVDIQKGCTQKILSANQLKSEVLKRTGQRIKSQAEFVSELRKAGRDDLIIAVDRRATNEYVIPDKLDEAIKVVFGKSKQHLLGQ